MIFVIVEAAGAATAYIAATTAAAAIFASISWRTTIFQSGKELDILCIQFLHIVNFVDI